MASSPTIRPTRVFIDSSVLIAAAISQTSSARDLLLLGLTKEFSLCISSFVLEETERNLTKKAPQAVHAFQLLQLTGVFDVVPDPSKQLVLRAAKVVELKDAPIIAGAISAHAEYLATYDQRHLLSSKEQISSAFGIQVVMPADLVGRGR